MDQRIPSLSAAATVAAFFATPGPVAGPHVRRGGLLVDPGRVADRLHDGQVLLRGGPPMSCSAASTSRARSS